MAGAAEDLRWPDPAVAHTKQAALLPACRYVSFCKDLHSGAFARRDAIMAVCNAPATGSCVKKSAVRLVLSLNTLVW